MYLYINGLSFSIQHLGRIPEYAELEDKLIEEEHV